ncbi:Variant SH3 domain containing protein [Tritrichomonas foetus]|uniref:Variant SH3 domain containing protein n=1 Tax=Tritrichomonas foetus TaxID=1144522 RepID=A0A1J4JMG8_9EUKA|nr:Variant SH3 domain containing protein [Tritrichomonas foetus]|eukprot:OHS98452.1 Variant SH3 domain containing protein [Tritrichomonas foetus]
MKYGVSSQNFSTNLVMSNCQELVTIFDRIITRIDKGSENYTLLAKYVSHRIEIEEKISQQLKSIIPSQFDTGDLLISALLENVKSEAEQHQHFATDLRKQISVPANTYVSTMRENQKKIGSTAKNSRNTVQKAISDTEKAQKEVDAQKAKCNGLAGSALTKQQRKVVSATKEHQVKVVAEAKTAQTISLNNMPNIHREFSEFDSIRLQKLQRTASAFITLKSSLCDAIKNGCSSFQAKMASFDGKDRSERYIARVFDTTNSNMKEDDPDLCAIAVADYRSDDTRDLQFVRGEKIYITAQHHSGWWEGRINDKVGVFPKTFVTMPGSVELRKDPIGAVFLVTEDYSKAKGGDISLLTGDLVYVDYVSKDRCSGTNIRDKKRGYFPLTCLECRI